MSPDQTVGSYLVTEPIVQIALILSGMLLLWLEVRALRNKLKEAPNLADGVAVRNLSNDFIAVRAKPLVGSVISIQGGLCLLLARTNVIPTEAALGLFAILIVSTLIPAILYFMFYGAPAPLLRWLLADLRLSQTNST